MHMVRPTDERVYVYTMRIALAFTFNQNNNNKIIVFIKLFPIYVCTYCVCFTFYVRWYYSDRLNQKNAFAYSRDVEIEITIHARFSVC